MHVFFIWNYQHPWHSNHLRLYIVFIYNYMHLHVASFSCSNKFLLFSTVCFWVLFGPWLPIVYFALPFPVSFFSERTSNFAEVWSFKMDYRSSLIAEIILQLMRMRRRRKMELIQWWRHPLYWVNPLTSQHLYICYFVLMFEEIVTQISSIILPWCRWQPFISY